MYQMMWRIWLLHGFRWWFAEGSDYSATWPSVSTPAQSASQAHVFCDAIFETGATGTQEERAKLLSDWAWESVPTLSTIPVTVALQRILPGIDGRAPPPRRLQGQWLYCAVANLLMVSAVVRGREDCNIGLEETMGLIDFMLICLQS